MELGDIGGLVASAGLLLLALGQTGGPTLPDHPPLGTYLGLSLDLTLTLSMIGLGLVVGVAVIGTILNELEDDDDSVDESSEGVSNSAGR